MSDNKMTMPDHNGKTEDALQENSKKDKNEIKKAEKRKSGNKKILAAVVAVIIVLIIAVAVVQRFRIYHPSSHESGVLSGAVSEAESQSQTETMSEESGQNILGQNMIGGKIPEKNILEGNVQVWDLTEMDEATAFALDLDSDGKRERISIFPEDFAFDGLRNYELDVNGSTCQGIAENMEPSLLAVSLDGKNILLAVFEEGPSGDPKTSFYYFAGGKLNGAGEIPGDIRTLERDEDGYIRCGFRADVIQTVYAFGYWYWDGSKVVRREDEGYICTGNRDDWGYTDLEKRDWFTLKETVLLYSEKDESSGTVTLNPQKVIEIMTDADEWTCLRGEDGTEGWLHVVDQGISGLGGKSVMEVFDGLSMAG